MFAYLHGLNQGEACSAVAEELGLTAGPTSTGPRPYANNPNPEPEPEPEPWQPIMPVPEDAPEFTSEIAARFAPAGFRYTATWDYVDAAGHLFGHVVRFDRPANGSVAAIETPPFTFCAGLNGERAWRSKAMPEPRPLYGLPRLASEPETRVLIVEGEKTADAAGDLFGDIVPVTSAGGSNAARKTDWSPLKGRRVAIWPDRDEPGTKYAVAVAAEARAAGAADVFIVTVPDTFPIGWDLADELPAGVTQDDLADLLADAPAAPNPPPPPGSSRTNNTDWKQPRALPHGLSPVASFDPDMVPASIGPWVADIAERMQCPPDFVGVSAMVGLASVLGRKIAIKPQARTDWTEVPNLWGCIVGRPGAMKSPAMNEALKPLNRIKADTRKDNEQDQKRHVQAMMLHKIKVDVAQAAAKAAMKNGGNPSDALDIEEPERPEPKRYVTNDSTYEALGAIIAANPNGVLVFRDELVSLLKTLDREEYAAARGFYLSAWNGTGGYTFDRIVRGLTHVDAVCVSMLGSTQPGRLADYLSRAVTGSAGDDGLIQRFGPLVWPDDNSKWKEVDRYPDSAAKERVWSTFTRLDRLTADKAGAEKDTFDHIPHLRFDAAALDLFGEWRADLERRLKAGALHSSVESHLAKYRKLVPAMALINHLADSGHGPIGETALLKALAFATYLETHTMRAYGSGTQTEVATATAILAKIRKGDLSGEFTARDVLQRDWSNLNQKPQVTAGLELLDDLDWVASRDIKTGGRPKTIYTVNPRGSQ